MSSDAFRQAIHEAVGPYIEADCGPFQHGDIVDAVLTMPEMEAIRRFIEDTAITNGIGVGDESSSFWKALDGTRVQQSVIDWVLGGPS